MKIFLRYILFAVIIFTGTHTYAQVRQNISGVVVDEKGQPVKGAIVFIGGSERVMSTDENGKFIFADMPQGTFQLSVQLIGYFPLTRNVIVQAAPVNVEVQLKVKTISLDEVVIGKTGARNKNFKLFEENFLGRSENAKQCVILNPKVINFSTKKGLLFADADDFLIIENKRLGYRIHYQLKDFGYKSADDIALYHGECSFEELDGTADEKKEWAKNRLQTYQGSFMHFLRSVYSNKVLENGFITKPSYGYVTLKHDDVTSNMDRVVINDRPVRFDSLITTVDSNFISLKFKQLLYVIYDPRKAPGVHTTEYELKRSIDIDKKASVVNLGLKEAIIDRKGSYTDYRDFFIHGNWARARVADQLPVEYQPPVATGDDLTYMLAANLQQWADSIPQEKTYLHLDKPYYALGDTIWFKGYVTIGSRHQLSKLSGSLYVDLITEKDSVFRSLKLPITTGMVMGDFTLGDDFKEGSYRIRAYTQWMRNAGEDYFFDRTFTVGNIVSHNIITKADYQYKTINGIPVLTATLNYTTDEGKPLAGKDVHYQIIINKKVAWSTSAKTDLKGNIPVKISNEQHVDLSGAYITTILDGSDKNTITRDFPIKAALSQSDVQFFPESGNLVNGLTSRVAFKAIGVDGAGISIKGKITDNDNKEIAEIETLHAGMGSFLLHPQAGKTYTAYIIFADGTTKNIALPKSVNEGYVLSIYQPNPDSILVRISASAALQKTTVGLIAQTSGEAIFASPVKIEKATTSVWLEKKAFPTGIAQFTIFNNNGEPLNERIAFIRGNDLMKLDVKTVKSAYRSKEHININLEAKDSKGKGVPGNFSVT
ncbi:MAG: hypothetical protein JWQ34_439, partial [Mucilaginibacter sp.]|uniref:carboxypeptidase-like regulatory domain-containing protein n=1 Tax=Mucilaginibacter sp. TaxID=1882438 RepID=UPI0026312EE7